jgi:hypothetical protein
MSEADRAYHNERARSELDLAYRAERKDVADAHMRLAALHMARLKPAAAPIHDAARRG